MIVIIDNYDSFTYNLYQYLGEIHPDIRVFRNDEISINELKLLPIDRIVISPGPGYPRDAGISKEVVMEFGNCVPILGVCLGHQTIAESYGGKVCLAKRVVHGKTSLVKHNGEGLFAKIPQEFVAMRYHSLIVEAPSIPEQIEVTAWTEDGEIMALKHRELSVYGIQFHPESIFTKFGKELLQNFLDVAKGGKSNVITYTK